MDDKQYPDTISLLYFGKDPGIELVCLPRVPGKGKPATGIVRSICDDVADRKARQGVSVAGFVIGFSDLQKKVFCK